jgi:hypothetical protein
MVTEIAKKLFPSREASKTSIIPAIWNASPTSTGGGRISLIPRTVKKVCKNTLLVSIATAVPALFYILVLEGVGLELQLLGEDLQLLLQSLPLLLLLIYLTPATP